MSFIEISENSKIAALEHKFEKLDVYNCWASSRWEHAYIYTCINWVDSTVTIFGRSIKINVPYVEKCTVDIINYIENDFYKLPLQFCYSK